MHLQLFLFHLLIRQSSLFEANLQKQEGLKEPRTNPGSESSCSTDNDVSVDCNIVNDEMASYKLHRWDPVKVGHVREIELENGKTHKMVTMAVNPPIFVIENYMEDYECDHILNKAKEAGLFSSELHIDPETLKSKDYTKYQLQGYASNFDAIDLNKDETINLPEEFQKMAYNINYLYLNEEDINAITAKFEVNVSEINGKKCITRENYNKINHAGLHEYIIDIKETHPRHRDRFSEQVWMNVHNTGDKTIDKLMERLVKVTGLHHEIVFGTEPIQVVKYLPHGHYHAHFDSQDKKSFPDFPCCHTLLGGTSTSCRICRYLTALVYLNDVKKGGETAFPVADDATYTHQDFLMRRKGDMYNLSQFCRNGSVVVSPQKGTMVLWYNHLRNEDGYLGVLDPYSLHGGCDVIEGEKWIANNWIPAPETPNHIYKNIYKPNYIPNPANDFVDAEKSEDLSEKSETAISDEL